MIRSLLLMVVLGSYHAGLQARREAERMISIAKEDGIMGSPHLNSLCVVNQIQNPVEGDDAGYISSSSSTLSSSFKFRFRFRFNYYR